MSLRSSLYRSARLLGDAQALASGNPKRITRRAKNKLAQRFEDYLTRTANSTPTS
jgi:hypothetical protein